MRSNRSIVKDLAHVAAGLGIAGGAMAAAAAPAQSGASTTRTCNDQSIDACTVLSSTGTWKTTVTNNTGGTINGLLQLTWNTVVVETTDQATLSSGDGTFTPFYRPSGEGIVCSIYWRDIGGSWSIGSSQCVVG